MLAKRVIPTMLVRGRTLVKGIAFDAWRSIGHAAQAARVHARRGVDELLILDISATAEGRGPDLDLVRELSADCFIPITVGGGVRTMQQVDGLLRAGADKVAVCTAAAEDPHLIRQWADRFGSQAIVVAIDHRDGLVWSNCGTFAFDRSPAIWAKYVAKLGAGEILLTDISRDGKLEGYDLKTLEAVAAAVSIPVIAGGGCGTYEHMLQAIRAGADAVAAGAMFAFTDATPRGAAQYLQAHGIPVRL